MSKKHVRGVANTTKMLISEQIGYGVAGKIAELDTTGIGNQAFQTGSALAGMPSLISGVGNVMEGFKTLDYKPRKRRK